MFIFLILYIFFFCASLYWLLKDKPDAFLLFVIFGLPMYITSLSVAFLYGFREWIPFLQSFKEILVLITLLYVVLALKKRPVLQKADLLVVFFAAYTLLYVFLPMGEFSFKEKLLSYKSISFFPFIYFIGRFIQPSRVQLSRQFHYMCLLAIAAAVVVMGEFVTYTHLQESTGYADYMYYYFNQEPSGHYGLSWTFEIEDGPKRFASFFANPLDHAAGTLVALSAIAAIITTRNRRIKLNNFVLLAIAASLVSVIFALSRASFISYFIMLYAFAFITRKKKWLQAINYCIAAAVIGALIWIKGDLYSFIVNTITFTNSSSLSHIIDWLEAINAIIQHPLGVGLGFAGRIGTTTGMNIGGENQLLIIGVQTGVIGILTYLWLYIYIIRTAFWLYRHGTGQAKKLGLFVLLVKIGMIIPMLTAEVESYVYVSYISWFMAGLLTNMKYRYYGDRRRYYGSEAGGNRPENTVGGVAQTIPFAGK